MTLRELINSVDSEQYSDSALYQKLRETKPEYGANRRIQVKLVNGEVTITNAHVGSLGDILTYPIDVLLFKERFIIHLFLKQFLILLCRLLDGLFIARQGSKGSKLGSTVPRRHLRMTLRYMMWQVDDIVVIIHFQLSISKSYALCPPICLLRSLAVAPSE